MEEREINLDDIDKLIKNFEKLLEEDEVNKDE